MLHHEDTTILRLAIASWFVATALAGPVNYAMVNHSGLHLRWTVESVPNGVTFTAPRGLIPPLSGAHDYAAFRTSPDQSRPGAGREPTHDRIKTRILEILGGAK